MPSHIDLDTPIAPQYQINPAFDPWNQLVNITWPDGTTTVSVPLHDVMALQRSAVYQAISGGLQTGAAFLLLIVLLLVTNKEKRRSWVFILNVLALVFTIGRGVISFAVFDGPFFNFYRWILRYYDGTDDAKAVSAAGEVVTFLITVTIEMSLVLQVRIVCCNLTALQQLGINMLNMLVAFVVSALRFSLMVLNIAWAIEGIEQQTLRQFEMVSTLASAANITLVISIGISSVIFCAKLAFAIRSRRSMGMTQFGPMQIIFIMGCQTMCTPRKSIGSMKRAVLTSSQSSSPSSRTGVSTMRKSQACQPPLLPCHCRFQPCGLQQTQPTAALPVGERRAISVFLWAL